MAVYTQRVGASNLDGEEINNGNATITSTDLEIGEEASVGQENLVGQMFTGFWEGNGGPVEKEATIDSAIITYTVDEPTTAGTVTVNIKIEKTAAPAVYSGTTDMLSDRSYTTAQTNWVVQDFTAENDEEDTPDFKVPVQEVSDEVTDLDTNGDALSIVADGINGVTNTEARTAESWDGESGSGPLLTLNYTNPGGIARRVFTVS